MPTKHKYSRFNYRRAIGTGIDDGSVSLEKALLDAHNRSPSVGDRTFTYSGGMTIEGAAFKVPDKDGGLLLHIAVYVLGQPTSTIGHNPSASESDTFEEEAPYGKDYLDGDVFVYVKENDAILCLSRIRETAALNYLSEILKCADYDHLASTLQLEKIANADKVAMINTEGVHAIELDCSLYDASVVAMENSGRLRGLLGGIADAYKAVVFEDDALADIDDRENLNVKLSLSFDGRAACSRVNKNIEGFGEAGEARLRESALMLLQDEPVSGYKIYTKLGNEITPEQLKVSKQYKVIMQGKSLQKASVWEKLLEYYSDLRYTGVLNE